MTDAERIFEAFPEFIKEYIYSHGWEELREVQLAAADAIFNTDKNVLLSSSTASGKTEAALFPILSDLYYAPCNSVGVIYIAPLKSLINDQFRRIDELLDDAGIPVFHWHGDVGASHKQKLLKDPRGILQITPESLESMLVNRSNDLVRIFGDLRYVVIDEIHVLMGSDRGEQILCQLSRLAEKIGRCPRRIALSATVGDVESAARWLSSGSSRETVVPSLTPPKIKWRLGLEHFFVSDDVQKKADEQDKSAASASDTDATDVFDDTCGEQLAVSSSSETRALFDAGYEYLYECVYSKRAIVFSNSREQTEYVTATLRQICRERGDEDVFFIHHGNISASLREYAEEVMKKDDAAAVTCATVTMELGIDIGKLERVAQVGAPNSVSNFLQRLGRSGRRGAPPEMMMVFREEEPLPNAPLPQLIPWELLRAIAIVQLYIESRFIEPPSHKKLPYSLAFQQTLSVLASFGELTAKELAAKVLSLPSFSHISRESYRELLVSMVKGDFIEMTDEGTLIVGLGGEKLTNSFKFYAVFDDSEDFTVRCGSDEIGTITTPPPIGDRFALAGKVWEVTELDMERRLIYVKSVEGKMEISWPGDYGEIHTRILERMRDVLLKDTEIYAYLKPNAQKRLCDARALAKNTGMDRSSLVGIGGFSYCIFPWLGTKASRSFRRYFQANAVKLGISGIEFSGCEYITFKYEGDAGTLLLKISEDIEKNGTQAFSSVSPTECPNYDKYDRFLPPSLLREAYVSDRLDAEGAARAMRRITEEYTR